MISPENNILIGSKQEGEYEIIESNTHSGGWNQKQFSDVAFDENLTSIFELCKTDEYFILYIKQKSNIYRYTNYYANKVYNDKLTITNTETNEDVTDLYTLNLSEANNTWELFIKDIPEGTYKFTCSGVRVDSEWFIEKAYKNIKDSVYDTIRNHELIQKYVIIGESEE